MYSFKKNLLYFSAKPASDLQNSCVYPPQYGGVYGGGRVRKSEVERGRGKKKEEEGERMI